MPDPTTPEGRAAIRERAECAQVARNDIYRCEFMNITPAPYSHRQIAASQADVPALLDALDDAEAAIDSIREYAQFLRAMADEVRQLDAVYQARVYDDIATTLERKIGDRT